MRLSDAGVRAALASADGPWNSRPGLRDAAVLLILVSRPGGDFVLFTRRRDDLPWHAGQVSFPGGAREGDESPARCALREAAEEVGLVETELTLLGRLPDRYSIAGFWVAPIVGRLAAPRPYAPQTAEVAEVFEVPLQPMFDPERWRARPSTHPRARGALIPFFDHEGRTVWGLTAMILRDFLALVPPGA
ncbi:MAG: NUDIX hydrolase [Planctomycetota bacterium]